MHFRTKIRCWPTKLHAKKLPPNEPSQYLASSVWENCLECVISNDNNFERFVIPVLFPSRWILIWRAQQEKEKHYGEYDGIDR